LKAVDSPIDCNQLVSVVQSGYICIVITNQLYFYHHVSYIFRQRRHYTA